MKEQEVIKRLNFHKEYARLSSNRVVISETDLETVLSMLKEKDADIEEYKRMIAAKDELVQEKNKEIEKKDKQIDLMAEYISTLDIDEDVCSKIKKSKECDKFSFGECENCIKQYFERKSEE